MNTDFNDVLKSLEHPPIKLLRSHADHVRAVWNDLTVATNGRITPPRATLQDDGDVTFEWSTKQAYIGIDISVQGWTWFARDHVADTYDGSPNGSFASLLRYIEKFAVTEEAT